MTNESKGMYVLTNVTTGEHIKFRTIRLELSKIFQYNLTYWNANKYQSRACSRLPRYNRTKKKDILYWEDIHGARIFLEWWLKQDINIPVFISRLR